ncbi:MAG: transglycosylase domain-containing protein, partial [Rhizobacter sp.]
MSESTRATPNNATSSPGPKVSGGPRWLRWAGRVALWCAGTVAAGVFAVLLLAGIALAVAYPHLPQISGLVDYRPKLPMRIYSADDVLLGEFGEERRSFTPIGQVPKIMKDAVLAIEDARFYEHSGVDYKGVLRAGLAHLGDARSQGASTITMQVARNFYLSMAVRLERVAPESVITSRAVVVDGVGGIVVALNVGEEDFVLRPHHE